MPEIICTTVYQFPELSEAVVSSEVVSATSSDGVAASVEVSVSDTSMPS